ncbi:acetylcholine receptor subunit alpha-type unc-38-like [Ptychodera flava]|uniref:acetylcholine receptor subunit alpha-type unc-38-like n=1 Tax=Ptychodera flava TaxID=63121 RepID=UPI00396A989F
MLSWLPGILLLYTVTDKIESHVIEEKLQRDLFANYSRNARPAEEHDMLHMQFQLWINLLLDVDEIRQVIITSGWIELGWTDMRLQWNETDVGLQRTIVPTDWIWQPDIVLVNSANKDYALPSTKRVVLYNNGFINLAPAAVFETPCTIDIRHFPFDVQRCQLIFESWTYTTEELVLRLNSDDIRLESLTLNTEWDIINTTAEIMVNSYFGMYGSSWSRASYTLVLARRPLYYITNMVLPCMLLAVLTLFVFWLPCDSGEKVSFSVSILIALSVFYLLVGSIMPSSDSVPLMVRYLLYNTFFVAASIVTNVFVLRLHHQPVNNRSMGRTTQKVFLEILPKFLFLPPYENEDTTLNPVDGAIGFDKEAKDGKSAAPAHQDHWIISEIAGNERSNAETGCVEQLSLLRQLVRDVNFLKKEMQDEKYENKIFGKWKYVAVVVDRLCFIITLLSYVIATMVVFLDHDQ